MCRGLLCVAAGFFFGFVSACGDLSEIDDDRIRNFVKTAKRVIFDELLTDGNTEDEIDDKMNVIVEALEQDEEGGNGDQVSEAHRCRETGRKTAVMFRDPAGHLLDYFNDPSGFTCSSTDADSTECSDGDDVCACDTDDTLNPAGSTKFAVTCTESDGSGVTFDFSDAETLVYDAPPSSSAYSIMERNQNEKAPGVVFPITVVDSNGVTVTPTDEASLAVYDSDGDEVDGALATWKTAVGDDIYDLSAAAGDSASFEVFLVRDTAGVAEIGGTVDGTAIAPVTLTAGDYTGENDILAIDDDDKILLMFSGAAYTALNTASKLVSYVVTDANGEVQESVLEQTVQGIDVQGASGRTFATLRAGGCVVGHYVLVRIGRNADKVYLVRCQTQSQ